MAKEGQVVDSRNRPGIVVRNDGMSGNGLRMTVDQHEGKSRLNQSADGSIIATKRILTMM